MGGATAGDGEVTAEEKEGRREVPPTFQPWSVAPPGGEGGKLPPYGWTSKNYVICVCFHCHGTSSYHDKYIARPSTKEPR